MQKEEPQRMFYELVDFQDESTFKDLVQWPKTGLRDLQLFSDLMVVFMINLGVSS
jgi:hypothetical protein